MGTSKTGIMLTVFGMIGLVLVGYADKADIELPNLQMIVLGLVFLIIVGLIAFYVGWRRHMRKRGFIR